MTRALHEPVEASYAPAALVALAAASFVYVTSETLPIGLLPQISDNLNVSDGRVGLLVTFYAALAALTAIPFTAWTTRIPRRQLILAVLSLFVASQIVAALAPGYWWLVVARLVCALGHGVFWAVIAPIAARLAPPGHAGRATAVVFVGNSLALVIGVPLGTLLGQLAGWRAAFAVIGVAGAVAMLALWRLLPPLAGEDDNGLSIALVRRLCEPRLAATYAITLVVVIGHFAAYSYIAPLAREHGGFTGTSYSVLLLGYGAAGLLAMVALGRIVDKRPRIAFAIPVTVIAVALALLGLVHHNALLTAVTVLAWGGAFTALPVILQAAVLRLAAGAADVASAVYVVAFQIGIGGGAWFGGVLVDGGHLDAVNVVGAGCAACALAIGLTVAGLFPTTRPSSALHPAVSASHRG